jgi:hypothetical protein
MQAAAARILGEEDTAAAVHVGVGKRCLAAVLVETEERTRLPARVVQAHRGGAVEVESRVPLRADGEARAHLARGIAQRETRHAVRRDRQLGACAILTVVQAQLDGSVRGRPERRPHLSPIIDDRQPARRDLVDGPCRHPTPPPPIPL